MKFANKEAFEKLHLISELSVEDCKNLCDSVVTLIVLNHIEGEPTLIPGFGEVRIFYEGEDLVKEGKQARIKLDFTPDDFLLRNIGQVHDGEETDIERKYKERLKGLLNELVAR